MGQVKTMEGECIREEIYTYFGRSAAAPSKAAFYRQLHKLKDGALRCLLLSFNRQLKNNLFNGKYRISANLRKIYTKSEYFRRFIK